MTRPWNYFLPLALVAACSPVSSHLTEADRAATEAAVVARMEEFWAAWRNAEFERALTFYADTSTFTWGANGTTWNSRVALDSVFRPLFAQVKSEDITIIETRPIVLSRDLVFITNRGSHSQTTTDGTTTRETPFAYTTLWVNRAGQWQIMAGHASEAPATP